MIRRPVIFVAVIAACLGLAVTASADMVSYTASVGATLGNWTRSVSIPKFDPFNPNPAIPGSAPGTLRGIIFELEAGVSGDAIVENHASTSQPFAVTLGATVTLERPDLTTLVVSIPLVNSPSQSIGPYDGKYDYTGTDSYTWTGLTATKTETKVAPPPTSDLALFTGTGDISLPVKAEADNSYNGHGFDRSKFTTWANANIRVTYLYYTPEPGSLALLGLGLPLAGIWFRRRKK